MSKLNRFDIENFTNKIKKTAKVVDFETKDAKDAAIKKGTHDELESMVRLVTKKKEKETNPNFAKPGEEPEVGQSTVDGSHHTSKKPKKLNKTQQTAQKKSEML